MDSKITNYKILRLPDVKERIGLGRSSIYARIADGTFPKPFGLGGKAVGFLETEIDEWIKNRIEARRGFSSNKD